MFDPNEFTCSDLTLRAIQASTASAIRKHGISNTTKSKVRGRFWKLSVLTEELGEIAEILNEQELGNITPEEARNRLVKELLDLCAGAALWIDVEDEKR